MTRKYLRERQARKQAEGKQDAANRCGFCRQAKPLRIGGFCCYDCERDAAEAAEQRKLMEARR